MDLLTDKKYLIEDNIYNITAVIDKIVNIRKMKKEDISIEKLTEIKNKYGDDIRVYVPINLEKLQQEIKEMKISEKNTISLNSDKGEDESKSSQLISSIKEELLQKCIIKTTVEKYCSSEPDKLLETNPQQHNTYILLNLNDYNEKTKSVETNETSIQELVDKVDEIIPEEGWELNDCNDEDDIPLPKIFKTKYQLDDKNIALFSLKRFQIDYSNSSNVNERKFFRPCIINEQLNLNGEKVSLRALIIHSGSSIQSGHYYALIVLNGKLYELNDSGQENYMEERDIDILQSKKVKQNVVLVCYSHIGTKTRSESEMKKLYAKNSNNNCYVHSLFGILYFIGINSVRELFTKDTKTCNTNILEIQKKIFGNNSQQAASELLEKIGHTIHTDYSKIQKEN